MNTRLIALVDKKRRILVDLPHEIATGLVEIIARPINFTVIEENDTPAEKQAKLFAAKLLQEGNQRVSGVSNLNDEEIQILKPLLESDTFMTQYQNELICRNDTIAQFAQIYADKPSVRALFMFVTGIIGSFPGANAFTDTIRELIASGVDDIQKERQREYFDELAVGENYLNADIVKNNDFIHAFMCTYRAALRTRHKEKIRMFVRILLTGVRENRLDSEELEEFISILDDISMRELELLLILKKFEDENPFQRNEKGDLETQPQRTNRYWEKFLIEACTKLKTSRETVIAILSRLNRTGLYQIITGAIWGYSGNQGYLTELFTQFSHWLEKSS